MRHVREALGRGVFQVNARWPSLFKTRIPQTTLTKQKGDALLLYLESICVLMCANTHR